MLYTVYTCVYLSIYYYVGMDHTASVFNELDDQGYVYERDKASPGLTPSEASSSTY